MKKLILISDEEYRRLCLSDGIYYENNIDKFNTFLLEKDTGNLVAFSNMPNDVDTPIEYYYIVDVKE